MMPRGADTRDFEGTLTMIAEQGSIVAVTPEIRGGRGGIDLLPTAVLK